MNTIYTCGKCSWSGGKAFWRNNDPICPECKEPVKLVEFKYENALGTQEGGDHYKSMAIQPVEYIHANNIGYCEGAVIKYVSRWKSKNGLEDLRKARHFIDLLIDLEAEK